MSIHVRRVYRSKMCRQEMHKCRCAGSENLQMQMQEDLCRRYLQQAVLSGEGLLVLWHNLGQKLLQKDHHGTIRVSLHVQYLQEKVLVRARKENSLKA